MNINTWYIPVVESDIDIDIDIHIESDIDTIDVDIDAVLLVYSEPVAAAAAAAATILSITGRNVNAERNHNTLLISIPGTVLVVDTYRYWC